jgi:dienelactone hydrolase
MPIRLVCPGCQKAYQVAETAAGKDVRCKGCGGTIHVPQPETDDDDALFSQLEEDGAEDRAADPPDVFAASSSERRSPIRKSSDRSTRGGQRPRKTGRSRTLKWILILSGGAVAAALLCCGGGFFFLGGLASPPVASAEASEPFPLARVKIPAFPGLATPQTLQEGAISIYQVDLAPANPGNMQPGARMKLRVYLPAGEHPERSLGCVLVGPAGTNLMTGNDIDDASYHTETLPYAQAGYVVVTFSLDGPVPAGADASSGPVLLNCYRDFSAAFAGLANARIALEFVLDKLPQVDPQRIFAAGHSSAGTLALLFAEHEPRLKGCIAYAPAVDIESHLSMITRIPLLRGQLPGIVDFAKRSSPKTHVAQLTCPLFLFWAFDDPLAGGDVLTQFSGELTRLGHGPTIKTVATGGHYEPMVNPGISLAIEWLRSLPGESAAP